MGTSGILLSLLLFSSILAQYNVTAGSLRPLSTSLSRNENGKQQYETPSLPSGETAKHGNDFTSLPLSGKSQPTLTSDQSSHEEKYQDTKPVSDSIHYVNSADGKTVDAKDAGRSRVRAISAENAVSTREGTFDEKSGSTSTESTSSSVMSRTTSGEHPARDKKSTGHRTRENVATKPATVSGYYVTSHRDRNTETDDGNPYNQDYRRDRYVRKSGNGNRNTDDTWSYRQDNGRTSGDHPFRSYYNNYGTRDRNYDTDTVYRRADDTSAVRDVDFSRPGGLFAPPERDVNSHLWETGNQGVRESGWTTYGRRYGNNDGSSSNRYYRRNNGGKSPSDHDRTQHGRRTDNTNQGSDYDRTYSEWKKVLDEQSRRWENTYYGRDRSDVGYNTRDYDYRRHEDYPRSNYNYDDRRDYGSDTNDNEWRYYVRPDGSRATSDRYARPDWDNGPNQRLSESSYNDRNTLERNWEQRRDPGSWGPDYQYYNYEFTDEPYLGTRYGVSREQYGGSTAHSGRYGKSRGSNEGRLSEYSHRHPNYPNAYPNRQDHNANTYGKRYKGDTDKDGTWHIYYGDDDQPDKWWPNHNSSGEMMEYQNSGRGEYKSSDKKSDSDRSGKSANHDDRSGEEIGKDNDKSDSTEHGAYDHRHESGESAEAKSKEFIHVSENHGHASRYDSDRDSGRSGDGQRSSDWERYYWSSDQGRYVDRSENERERNTKYSSFDSSRGSGNAWHGSRKTHYDGTNLYELYGERSSPEHDSNGPTWWYDDVNSGESAIKVPMYGKGHEQSMSYERSTGNPNDRYVYVIYRPKDSSSYYKVHEESNHNFWDIKGGAFSEDSRYGQHGKAISDKYPKSAVTHYWSAIGTKSGPRKIDEQWVSAEPHTEGERKPITVTYHPVNPDRGNPVYHDGERRYDKFYGPRGTKYSSYEREEDKYSQEASSSNESDSSSDNLSNGQLNDNENNKKVEAKVDAVESKERKEQKDKKEKSKATSSTYEYRATHHTETNKSEHKSKHNSAKEEPSKHDKKGDERKHRSHELVELVESKEEVTSTSEYEYNSKHASGSKERKHRSEEKSSKRHALKQREEIREKRHKNEENELSIGTIIGEAETETSQIQKLEKKLGTNENSERQVSEGQKSIEKIILQDEAPFETVMTSESKSDVEITNISEESAIHESEHKDEESIGHILSTEDESKSEVEIVNIADESSRHESKHTAETQMNREEIEIAEHHNQEKESTERITSTGNGSKSEAETVNIVDESARHESEHTETEMNLEEIEIAEHHNQEKESTERITSTENGSKSEAETVNIVDESAKHESEHTETQMNHEEIEMAEQQNQEEELLERIISTENESNSNVETVNIADESSRHESKHTETEMNRKEIEIAEHRTHEKESTERITSTENESKSEAETVNIVDESARHEREHTETQMNHEEIEIAEQQNQEEVLLERIISTENESKSEAEIVNIVDESARHESEHTETQMNHEEIEIAEQQNQEEVLLERIISTENESKSEAEIVNIVDESARHESEHTETQMNHEEIEIAEQQNQEEVLLERIISTENESNSDVEIVNIADESSRHESKHTETEMNREEIEIAEHRTHEKESTERITSTENESKSEAETVNIVDESAKHESEHTETQMNHEQIQIAEQQNQEEESTERITSTENESKSEVEIVNIADESSRHESKHTETEMNREEIEIAEHRTHEKELTERITSTENESKSEAEIVNIVDESARHESEHTETEMNREEIEIAEHHTQEKESTERITSTENESKSEAEIVNIVDESARHEREHTETQMNHEEIEIAEQQNQEEVLLERIISTENESNSDVEIVNIADESSRHESKHTETEMNREEIEIAEQQNQEKESTERITSTENESKSEAEIVNIVDESARHESEHTETQMNHEEIEIAEQQNQEKELTERITSTENESKSEAEIVNIVDESARHESEHTETQMNHEEIEIAEQQNQEEVLLERIISTENESNSDVEIVNIADESSRHESKHTETEMNREEIEIAEQQNQEKELTERITSTENESKSEAEIVHIVDESAKHESEHTETQMNHEDIEIAEQQNQEEELLERIISTENESNSDVEIVNIADESSRHESKHTETEMNREEIEIAEHRTHGKESTERITSTENESKSEAEIVNIVDESAKHESEHTETEMNREEIEIAEHRTHEKESTERITSTENESKSEAEIVNIVDESARHESEHTETQMNHEEIEIAEQQNQEKELTERITSTENESKSEAEIVNIVDESARHESEHTETQMNHEEIEIAEQQNQEEVLLERIILTENESNSDVEIVNIADESSRHESKHTETEMNREEIEIAEQQNQEKELTERITSTENESKSEAEIVHIVDESARHESEHTETQMNHEDIEIAEQQNQEEELLERIISTENESNSNVEIVNIADESSKHESKHTETEMNRKEIEIAEHRTHEKESTERITSTENESKSEAEIVNIVDESAKHESEHTETEMNREEIEIAEHRTHEKESTERITSTENESKSEAEIVNIADESSRHKSEHTETQMNHEEIEIAEQQNQEEELLDHILSTEDESQSEVETVNIADESSRHESEHRETQRNQEEIVIAEEQDQEQQFTEHVLSTENESKSGVEMVNIADERSRHKSEHTETEMNQEEIEISEDKNQDDEIIGSILSTEKESNSDVEIPNIPEESSIHESEHKEEHVNVKEIEDAEHQNQEEELIGRLSSAENEPESKTTLISASENSINEIMEKRTQNEMSESVTKVTESQLDNSKANSQDRITEEIVENQDSSSRSVESTQYQFRGRDRAQVLDGSENVSRRISEQGENIEDESTVSQNKSIEVEDDRKVANSIHSDHRIRHKSEYHHHSKEHKLQDQQQPKNHKMMHHSNARGNQGWNDNRSKFVKYKIGKSESQPQRVVTVRSWSINGRNEPGPPLHDIVHYQKQSPLSVGKIEMHQEKQHYIHSKEHNLNHQSKEHHQKGENEVEFYTYRIGKSDLEGEVTSAEQSSITNENNENAQEVHQDGIIENRQRSEDLAELVMLATDGSKSITKETETEQSPNQVKNAEHVEELEKGASKEHVRFQDSSGLITSRLVEPESETRTTESMQTRSRIENREHSQELQQHGKIESDDFQYKSQIGGPQKQKHSSQSLVSAVSESSSQAQSTRTENLENIRENGVTVGRRLEEGSKQKVQDLPEVITSSFDESEKEARMTENTQSWNEHHETKGRPQEIQHSKDYEMQHQGGATEHQLNHHSANVQHKLNDLGTDEDDMHNVKKLAELIAARLAASQIQSVETAESLNVNQNTESNPRVMGMHSQKSSAFQKENSGMPETKIPSEVMNKWLGNDRIGDIENYKGTYEDNFYESKMLRPRRQDGSPYYAEQRPERNWERGASKQFDAKITDVKSSHNRHVHAGNQNRVVKGNHNYESNTISATNYRMPNVVSKTAVVVPNQNRWYIIGPQYYSIPHKRNDYNYYGRRQYGYRRYKRPPVPRRPYNTPY